MNTLPLLQLAQDEPNKGLWLMVGLAIFVSLVLIGFFLSYGSLWLKAFLTGCYTGITDIVGMRLRGVSPAVIIEARIMAHKAGIPGIETDELESHYLARGNVPKVIQAIIAASKARIVLPSTAPARSTWRGVTFSTPCAPR